MSRKSRGAPRSTSATILLATRSGRLEGGHRFRGSSCLVVSYLRTGGGALRLLDPRRSFAMRDLRAEGPASCRGVHASRSAGGTTRMILSLMGIFIYLFARPRRSAEVGSCGSRQVLRYTWRDEIAV